MLLRDGFYFAMSVLKSILCIASNVAADVGKHKLQWKD